MQVHNLAAAAKMIPVGSSQDGSTTGRQHAICLLRQLIDDRLLDITEAFLAFALEELPDGAADALLDQMVRVPKRQIKSACQLSADCRFSRARKTDQGNPHRHVADAATVQLAVEQLLRP